MAFGASFEAATKNVYSTMRATAAEDNVKFGWSRTAMNTVSASFTGKSLSQSSTFASLFPIPLSSCFSLSPFLSVNTRAFASKARRGKQRQYIPTFSEEDEGKALKLSIVGRPNVGKSTLFNRLVGRRAAIVHETEGVTRDRQECVGQLSGIVLAAIDTPGLVETVESDLQKSAQARAIQRRHRNDVVEGDEVLAAAVEQARSAIEGSDAVLFLVDGKDGFTETDENLARWLLRQKDSDGHPLRIVPIINKCEGGSQVEDEAFYSLGMEEPVRVSAQHGDGIADLISAIGPLADQKEMEWDRKRADKKRTSGRNVEGSPKLSVPKIVIAGRPNVGKSTLINALCGTPRVRAGPEAGITRDPVSVKLDVTVPSDLVAQLEKKKKKKLEGKDGTADLESIEEQDEAERQTSSQLKIEMIDTAGLAKRTQDGGELQKITSTFTIRVINDAEVVVMMLDGTQPLIPTKQDLAILRLAEENGKGIVIVVNKTDVLKEAGASMKDIEKAVRDKLAYSFPHMEGVTVIFMSAKEPRKEDLTAIVTAALNTRKAWSSRIPTATLNKWLDAVMTLKPPPPGPNGQRVRIKYVTQSASKPPTFVFFGGNRRRAPTAAGLAGQAELPEHYLRFLRRSLREEFKLQGTPIRLQVRRYSHGKPLNVVMPFAQKTLSLLRRRL